MTNGNFSKRLAALNNASAALAGTGRAFLSFGLNEKWNAKRSDTGEIICSDSNRKDVATMARNMGFKLNS